MKPMFIDALTLHAQVERWPLAQPFRITGYTFDVIEVLVVSLEKNGRVGRGEATGIYYKGDTPAAAVGQIESLRAAIEAGISRHSVQKLLPPGCARNALDCALWDLEANLVGRPVWQLAGLEAPQPLLTTFGCGADTPEKMASVACAYKGARAIKLKLTGEPIDAERIRAVREALPGVWLGVDANQGFTRPFLEQLIPVLVQTRVSMIEQPFKVGQEELLEGFQSPIPVAADESVLSCADIRGLVGRFSTVNIKLDKCGGLSEALEMARTSREVGLSTMVGNMIGTSLAMAPGFLVGQLCAVVDLDGPLFLKSDRAVTVDYTDGLLICPETLWGGGRSQRQGEGQA